MKRILVILISLFSFAIVFADETEDSLTYYAERFSEVYEAGNYQEAYNYCEAVIRIYRSLKEDVSNDTDYALILYAYADCCYHIGEYEHAINKGTEALDIYKAAHGTDNLQCFQFFNILAMSYSKLGEYEKADQWTSHALEVREKLSKWDAHVLERSAKINYSRGNYSKAIELYSHASEILKKRLGEELDEEYLDYAGLLNDLACCYSCMKDYSKAIELLLQALEIRKKKQGEEHPDYATPLNNLVHCYLDLDDYPKAIELCLHASEILKKRLGEELDEEYLDYAALLYKIAGYYDHLGRYEKAVELGVQVLDIQKIILDEKDPAYAASLNKIASYYYHLGRYEKAVELQSQALEILGKDHPDYASSLNNLAVYYSMLDDYVKAIELGSQELEIRKRISGEENLDYAVSLYNLAIHHYKLGDYIKALELGSHALEIRKRISGEENLDYAASLDDLAGYYFHFGDYVKAIELGLQVLEIRKKKQGEDHPDYATSLNNLATYYSALGDTPKAIELGLQALEILKKKLGEEHPDYAFSLNSLANFYRKMGEISKAIELGSQALEIRKKKLGEEHLDYAASLECLAGCFDLNDYPKAIELRSQALEIRKNKLGEEHPSYAASLARLAISYFFQGNKKITIRLFEKYITIIRNNIFKRISQLTSNERQMFWEQYRTILNEEIPLVFVHAETPSSSSILYDNVALFSKGLLLSTEQEMAKLIQECGDDEAKQMYSELRQNRQMLNFQYSKPVNERKINCDSLERVSTELERKLGFRVEEFGDFKKNLKITWKDVQEKLDDSDIAIEFLSYPKAYSALTLCKNDTVPLLTQLFTESQLKEVAGDDDTYQNAAADNLLWGPLASRLEGKSRIYFSAAGMLHGIGIEYLPSMEGKECYRLSSTRELVTHKPGEGIKSATLFGGIDYDATYASIKSSAPSTPNNPSDLSAPSTILYAENTEVGPIIYKQGGRGGLDEYNSMRAMRYSVGSLPGSRKEIQSISALLKKSGFKIQDCDTITRNQASEESFKALSGQRRSLIHISTHGFYYDTIDAKNKGKHLHLMLMGDDRPSRSEDKSLLRCGLCFAGANQFLRELKNPAEGQDEGILNALEIAQTDLRGLDLVVLSACQTALGDVVNGEGVFGLQRGFKKAGAQSILMSLWKVDDDITALLMTEFYRAWTSTPGMTKAAALKEAQDIVRKEHPDPRHWAGFILLDALD